MSIRPLQSPEQFSCGPLSLTQRLRCVDAQGAWPKALGLCVGDGRNNALTERAGRAYFVVVE